MRKKQAATRGNCGKGGGGDERMQLKKSGKGEYKRTSEEERRAEGTMRG